MEPVTTEVIVNVETKHYNNPTVNPPVVHPPAVNNNHPPLPRTNNTYNKNRHRHYTTSGKDMSAPLRLITRVPQLRLEEDDFGREAFVFTPNLEQTPLIPTPNIPNISTSIEN